MTQTIEQLRARVAELEEQYQLATDVTNATLERNRELETSAATAVQQYKDEVMKLAGEPVAEVIRKFSYKGDFEMAVVRWAREIPAHGKDLFTSDQLVAATARLEAELTQCKDEKAMCLRVSAELRQQLAVAQLREQVLRDALIITHDLYSNAASGYGFARPENPHNFSPDFECCSQDEIKAHSKACEDYDAGRKISDESWGIGVYCEEYAPALEAISAPADTSALDAYVAEKVKEIIESHAPDWRNVTNAQHVEMRQKFFDQIATLTRQRDLAVEAITRAIDMVGHPGNITYLQQTLDAIKESEAK